VQTCVSFLASEALGISLSLLSKQKIQACEKLKRWQPRSIVIDSKLRLDGGIHDSFADLEYLSKTYPYRYQGFIVGDIETPNAARSNIVSASDAQSRDWLERQSLCLRATCSPAKECCQVRMPITSLPADNE
jgi:hypothetical protein